MNDGRPDNFPEIDTPNLPFSAFLPVQGDNDEPLAPSLTDFEEGIRIAAEAHALSAIDELRRLAKKDE